MKKVLSAILGLFLLGVLAIAASASSFEFNDVDINGVDMTANTLLYAERGETITIRTEFTSDENVNDVKLRAEIGGYEYEDVEAKTDVFDMEAGVTYYKTLRITLPEDMDASEIYNLFKRSKIKYAVYRDAFWPSQEPLFNKIKSRPDLFEPLFHEGEMNLWRVKP